MGMVLVVGNGAAGLFSAWLLARKGRDVTVVGIGAPSTSLSTGCLRKEPMRGREEVEMFLRAEEMPMVKGHREGISKIGTRFECWISPSHSTWEDVAPKSITVVGLEAHPSLHARLVSAVLRDRGIKADALILPHKLPMDAPLASVLTDDEAYEGMARRLMEVEGEAVLLPAFLPLRDYKRLDDLQERCGRRIFEAVTPLGVPGGRLLEIMRRRAAEVGAEFWDGRRVIALRLEGDAVSRAVIVGGLETREVEVDAVVVATGGPLVDGLLLQHRILADPFRAFRMTNPDDPLRGGYVTDDGMLVSLEGRRMRNVAGAGDCLADETRGRGSGLAQGLESAYDAFVALEGV